MEPGLVAPHLNADAFKACAGRGARRPPHHDYLRLHPDGAAMLGSSDLTGRYWVGAVKVNDSMEELRSDSGGQDGSTAIRDVIPLESGATDGCFLSSPNKVILTEDSGGLTIWVKSTNGEWDSLWSKVFEAEEHDDTILAMQCLQVDQHYVTVGADSHIKIWDIPDMTCMKTYRGAHEAMINDVSVERNSTNIFATASMDYTVTLWDMNCDKRVKVIQKSDCSMRCVSWLNDRCLLTGDEEGRVSIVDVRNDSAPVLALTLNFPTHRICVNYKTHHVAVCCDSQIVSVFDASSTNTLKLLHEDRKVHTGMVRGLAWDLQDDHVLYSVARDGILAVHAAT